MSAMGWFSKYIRERNRLYENVERRRELRETIAGIEDQQAQGEVEQLFDELSEVKLVLACIVNVALAKGLVTEEELISAADELDKLDGNADGKLTGKLNPDGTIIPDASKPPSPPAAIDELADAVDETE